MQLNLYHDAILLQMNLLNAIHRNEIPAYCHFNCYVRMIKLMKIYLINYNLILKIGYC